MGVSEVERRVKGSPQRQEAAHQILKIWRYETGQQSLETRGDFYISDRGAAGYSEKLKGLTATLDYASSLAGSNTVLDLGTDTGRACADLSKKFRDLSFIGTGLRRSPLAEKFLPGDKFKVTAAENLRGIANESIACVIANYSITYSHAQRLVAERLDEVLIPGGIIKASFLSTPTDQILAGLHEQSREFSEVAEQRDHSEFQTALLAMAYDTHAIQVKNFDYVPSYVLVAIKPGNPSSPTAKAILEEDIKQMQPKEKIKRWARRTFIR